ncbi:hypothetical protein GLOIN_2v1491645 [Rhizophagus irregularis DAOM 181602=DAOM 197198]|uniref:Secreted protein n=1 Tax=Rhizophagus irregularis (strain DAOM 181602 / DAOM 197198 / MUCL 43194) TaxID=747089 RepID=A0A2P4QZ64_RHIID|nr:hypothetical protein GLOIN_2v1491645 [Rhizophagus irregularis DAOM 181602=DAOM 197198]POG82946.1 hypothetical protein GLOIN_2v1491645 [Rhizophagus irregularis DAOM 181602=DAOM 197198]GET66309.1 hypothetical protein GLOIN_2v1491645 [Rhizophagus irregularis DAOM 181602=DAOM 197198]|eukprot:XP_025189812.1 hypothetical protein GLOIN_2v1491645 [Rhizophagus irregularis DAOM 181602=DAOM 197198]
MISNQDLRSAAHSLSPHHLLLLMSLFLARHLCRSISNCYPLKRNGCIELRFKVPLGLLISRGVERFGYVALNIDLCRGIFRVVELRFSL